MPSPFAIGSPRHFEPDDLVQRYAETLALADRERTAREGGVSSPEDLWPEPVRLRLARRAVRIARCKWPVVRALAILLALLLAATTTTTRAEGPPVWHVGHLSARGDASWWYAEVADGIAPEVWADEGEAGVDHWSFCPAPILQPQTCIVVAQGRWTEVRLGGPDGVLLHERGRAYLPGVSR